MDSKIFRIRESISPFAPDEYKRHAWEHLKLEMGKKLYELLEQEKNPIVVELNENIVAMPVVDKYSTIVRDDLIEIEVVLTPVQFRNVELMKYSALDWEIPKTLPKFIDRLYWAFTGKSL